MAKPAKPSAKAEPPQVDMGDAVYANHPKHGPMVVHVLAAGRDGFLAKDGAGAKHRIPHSAYLGHKARVVRTYSVVDQGADGAIVQDDSGKRKFIAGGPPAKPAKSEDSAGSSSIGHTDDPLLDGLDTLAKALVPLPPLPDGPILLLKAVMGSRVNRPGLTQRQITDKTGRRENRWVRSSPDQKKGRRGKKKVDDQTDRSAKDDSGGGAKPPAAVHKHGDDVTFRHGQVEGHGKIVASGKDGVTVQTPDGREHKVRHDALEPPHQYPEKAPGQDDKAYLKQHSDKLPSPKNMPEEHDRFFNMEGATTIPIDQLVSTKTDEENAKGGANAPKFMMAAYHGKVAKPDPITVSKRPDGKYQVEDGNGTFTGAKAAGWKSLPVKIQGGEDNGEPKTLFPPEITQGLPEKAKQPVSTKEELYAKAAEAQKQLQEWLNLGKGVASTLGYETMKGPPEDADMDAPGGMLFIAPLKGEKRAQEKVDQDYGGDWSQLLDPVRASMAVDTYDELERAMTALTASGMKLSRQPKDRFTKPLPVGYRDALLNVTLPNGLVGELQLHVKPMLKAKSEGHHHYEIERTLQGKKKSGLTDEETAKLQAAIETQTAIYGEAWKRSIGGRAGQEAMTKAMDATQDQVDGGEFSYFEHDNAYFRRKSQPPFREVDDVLHRGTWVPYSGDKLRPALFGDPCPDPLMGKTQGPVQGKPVTERKPRARR